VLATNLPFCCSVSSKPSLDNRLAASARDVRLDPPIGPEFDFGGVIAISFLPFYYRTLFETRKARRGECHELNTLAPSRAGNARLVILPGAPWNEFRAFRDTLSRLSCFKALHLKKCTVVNLP
jgi:hypothetical protein